MDVFAALADPLRRDLLLGLVGGSLRVVDMAAAHPVSRPAISRHLRLLSEAGLVQADDVGRERHYRLRAEPLADVEELLAHLAAAPRVSESALDALATEVHRTKRERRLQEETA
jgi:DNA-binding transcriptional ArsR family regulator